MSLTASHTVTRSGSAASARGSCSESASDTVEPDTPTLTYRASRSAVSCSTRGQAWAVGRSAPTPTVSLAPTATYTSSPPVLSDGPAAGSGVSGPAVADDREESAGRAVPGSSPEGAPPQAVTRAPASRTAESIWAPGLVMRTTLGAVATTAHGVHRTTRRARPHHRGWGGPLADRRSPHRVPAAAVTVQGMVLRIVFADDNYLVREGVSALLAEVDEI